MAITIPNVHPGDLITADAWNNIIMQLQALDARVSSLEGITPGGTGAFAITGLSATSLTVGDSLTVYGVHFGLIAKNFVTFQVGGQVTTVLQSNYDGANSNDKQLKFTIPPLSGLGGGGTATMQIVNDNGNDRRDLTVNPIVVNVPTGNLAVKLNSFQNISNAASNQVDAGGTFLLTYNIKAFTTRQDTYNLTLTSSLGTAAYVDDSLNPITPAQVVLPVTPTGGAGVNVKVLLKLTGITTGSGSVSLVATSQLNAQVTQPSGAQPYVIGGLLPSLGAIGISTSGANAVTGGSFDAKGVLDVKAAVECQLSLIATIPNGSPTGNYFVSFSFDSNPGGLWTARYASIGGNPFPWTTGQPRFTAGITGAAGAADTIVHIRINNGSDATGTVFGELPVLLHVGP